MYIYNPSVHYFGYMIAINYELHVKSVEEWSYLHWYLTDIYQAWGFAGVVKKTQNRYLLDLLVLLILNQASQFCQKKTNLQLYPNDFGNISPTNLIPPFSWSKILIPPKPPRDVLRSQHLRFFQQGVGWVGFGCLENFQIWQGRFSRWWWKNPTHLKNMRKSDLFHHFLQGSEWKPSEFFSKSKEMQPWSKLNSS